MDPLVKKTIGIIVAIVIIGILYVGTYLPYAKSASFINAMSKLGSIHSVQEFESTLDAPLQIWSPIGQEELVRNSANIILGVIGNTNNADIISKVVDYSASYFQPILDYGKGMSFEQNLYVLGSMNEGAFTKTFDKRYLYAAQKYYEWGNKLGPDRPQFLYGLFDVYRFEGNKAKAQEIGDKILKLWPSDQNVKALLQPVIASTSTNK